MFEISALVQVDWLILRFQLPDNLSTMSDDVMQTNESKGFFARNWESFLVEIVANAICWALGFTTVALVATSDWFAVKFMGQKIPITCEADLVSNDNLFLYNISLGVDWRNRAKISSIIFYGKSDNFFIVANSLEKNNFIRLKRRLGVEGDGSFYGAELEIIKDPPKSGVDTVKLQVRSESRIGGHKCDIFAFSEY